MEGGGYLCLFFDDYSFSYYKVIVVVLWDDDIYKWEFDDLFRDFCYGWNGEIGWEWDWYINEGYFYLV